MWELKVRCYKAEICGFFDKTLSKTKIMKKSIIYSKGRLSRKIQCDLNTHDIIFQKCFVNVFETEDIEIFEWMSFYLKKNIAFEFDANQIQNSELVFTFKFDDLDDAFRFRLSFGDYIVV